MGEWIRVANTDELSAGNGIVVEVNDKVLSGL